MILADIRLEWCGFSRIDRSSRFPISENTHASAVALVGRCGPGELYKIGLLVYKCFHGLAPGYLSDQCIPASTFASCVNMRSSSRLDRLLYVPRTKTKTLGPRWFYYASSAVWNSLPVDLRDPGLSLHSFITKLKSHFFMVD